MEINKVVSSVTPISHACSGIINTINAKRWPFTGVLGLAYIGLFYKELKLNLYKCTSPVGLMFVTSEQVIDDIMSAWHITSRARHRQLYYIYQLMLVWYQLLIVISSGQTPWQNHKHTGWEHHFANAGDQHFSTANKMVIMINIKPPPPQPQLNNKPHRHTPIPNTAIIPHPNSHFLRISMSPRCTLDCN